MGRGIVDKNSFSGALARYLGAAALLLVSCLVAPSAHADVMTQSLVSRTPVGSVPVSTPITFQLRLENEDRSSNDFAIGTGLTLRLDGATVTASNGVFTSSGCSVDSDPRASGSWACGAIQEGASKTV